MMSETQNQENFLEEVSLIYFLCYETNNTSDVGAFIENPQQKVEEWNNLPAVEKQDWVAQASNWLDLYQTKYPDHYSRILKGWKKIYTV